MDDNSTTETNININALPVSATASASAKLDVKVDLTESVNQVASAIIEDKKTLGSVLRYLIGGERYAKKKAAVDKITAEGEAEVNRIKAKSDVEVAQILENTQSDPPAEIDGTFSELVASANSSDLPTEIAQEVSGYIADANARADTERLLETVALAVVELNDIPDDELPDDEPDKDFLNKWRREAEIIEDEEIRRLWAKILVEEVKKTQSVSKRTLDVLKNISKEEAQLFEKVAVDVWDGGIYIRNHIKKWDPDEPFTPNTNLTFSNFQILVNANLIQPAAGEAPDMVLKNQKQHAEIDDQNWFGMRIAKEFWVASNQQLSTRKRSLTTAGTELSDLLCSTISDAQAIRIAKEFASRGNESQIFRLYRFIVNAKDKSRGLGAIVWTNEQPDG